MAIDRDADFFDIGGDSVGMIRLIAKAEEVFGVEIDVIGFLEHPTLAGLAAMVERSLAEAGPGADDLATILTEVEALSDAEVDAKLP